MKTRYQRKLINSVENAVGDLVYDVIDKYYGDRIESEPDYEKILFSIARFIKQEVFNNKATFDDVIEYLNRLRSRRNLAKLVLSYVISRALDEQE